jgi:thiol-disulfide isomerase/thioredoxin
MAEQKKRKGFWLVVLITAVILGAVWIWRAAFYVPAPPVSTENQHSDEHQQRSTVESGPKPTLNDIVSAARTWGPAYTSWFGKTAPDFTLTDLNGKQHKLGDYRGKDVMLVFWATWCGPCIMEIPHLIELRDTTGEDKLAILAITYTSVMPPNTIDRIRDFVRRNRAITYTILPADADQMPAPYNQVNAIPCSFFIDPQGKMKFATEGLISLREVRAILEAE